MIIKENIIDFLLENQGKGVDMEKKDYKGERMSALHPGSKQKKKKKKGFKINLAEQHRYSIESLDLRH